MNALQAFQHSQQRIYSQENFSAFHEYVKGRKPSVAVSAALYEAQSGGISGGVTVPVLLADGSIVPLAAEAGAVRRLASVIPTTDDLVFNAVEARGTAAAKAQLAPFAGTSPQFAPGGGFTLSAFMAGTKHQLTYEVAADYPSFMDALAVDFVPAQNAFEEDRFLNGTGLGQPEGMIGRVGAGVTAEPDSAGNLVSIDATESILDTLPSAYHERAAWLMRRSTARIIRRAQRQAGLVDRVWTRENGQDFLHGYPVEFSEAVPAAAPGAVPVLFGDFTSGYLVGDRGGSDIRLRVLDQDPADAVAGIVTYLTFRRCDGRVRRSEAIQQLACAV